MVQADFRTLGLVATILALGAFFGFVGGRAVGDMSLMPVVTDIDNRVPVALSPEQKAQVLKQMHRDFEALQGFQVHLAAGDLQTVAAIAESRGTEKNPIAPALAGKFSREWKTAVRDMREGFDEIAINARATAPTEAILSTSAAIMNHCIACHQTYRIVLAQPY
jgi:hypothetical protein